MLVIHRAERADALVSALGAVLSHPGKDPFAPEIVAVPSKGVERWLAQRLSHVLGAQHEDGVCANVTFPSFARLLDEAVAEADTGYAGAVERWAPERAVWPLMRVIDRCAPNQAWCAVLASHLKLDNGLDDERDDERHDGRTGNGRRFAVARKLAALFDRYGRSRPGMIRAWADGRDEQDSGAPLSSDLIWQAELWRRLKDELATPAPAELLDDACAAVGAGPDFSVFGTTRISPARIQVLSAVASSRDVHLWLHHPSPALWAGVNDAREQPGRRRSQRPAGGHPLLASMSRDVRELQQLLTVHPYQDEHHPSDHCTRERGEATLLGRLQNDLAYDRLTAGRLPISADDNSVQVHAAHGRARQVEIVREAILHLFAADHTLEPRDVVMMCPDVEAFAPLVAASFGMVDGPGSHPAAALSVKLADRSLRQTNPLITLLSQLLELAAGRVTSTQLLDLAGAPPVRRKFGFDDDDIERLRDWSVAAGARWGLDAEHRSQYFLGGIGQGTWRTAVDRLLLGVVMEDDVATAPAWLGDTVPLDDVDSGDIDVAGRFAELVDRVDAAVRAFGAPRTVSRWSTLLAQCIDDLGEGDEAWQMIQLRRELDDVSGTAADTAAHTDTDADADIDSHSGAEIELGLADVTALLHARLAGRPTRASFRTGSLTVCTLVPMRSVPHRVVCLLGMDDGAFPRQGVPDGDDILARNPRTGERDPRSEDRQLFLDAICAAQEHLIITYTGADPRSGADVPPCVPLGELLDALGATARAADGGSVLRQVVRHHPLQSFDRRNFVAGGLDTDGPFSFDPSELAGARAATGPRIAVPALVTGPLSPASPTDTVSLEDLIRFLQEPAKAFLRQRLGVMIAADDEDPDDALTVELAGLKDWAVGDRVLRGALGGVEPAVLAQLERLRGELPPGPLGARAGRRIGSRVNALLTACAAERGPAARSIDIAVPLDDGRVLAGTVGGVRGDTILSVSYSTLAPKHRLAAWVRYLAATATPASTVTAGATAAATTAPATDARTTAAASDGNSTALATDARTTAAATDASSTAPAMGSPADEDAPSRPVYRAVVVGRKGEHAVRSVLHGVSAAQARRLLNELVGIRNAGLREPLPLALATSAEYARRRARRTSAANALAGARLHWEAGERTERKKPEHVLVFGAQAPLERLTAEPVLEPYPDETTRFGALARLVWDPLLRAETDL